MLSLQILTSVQRTRTRVTSSPRALTRPARARARARAASPGTASTAKVSVTGVNWSDYKTILCTAYWQWIRLKKYCRTVDPTFTYN